MSIAQSTHNRVTAGPVLAVVGATKRFGSILALNDVSIEVRRGEILALLGDNGAGKSTLIKCISGVHRLDSGQILLDGAAASDPIAGRRARGRNRDGLSGPCAVRQSRCRRRISMPAGSLPFRPGCRSRCGCLGTAQMERATRELLDRLKVSLRSHDTALGLMSGGQRQAIAVARAAAFARKVVILDEPTAALGLRESRQVLDLIRLLRDEGNAVILITHNMEQVTELADRAVVMRQGRKVGDIRPDKQNQQDIVAMIVGAERAA